MTEEATNQVPASAVLAKETSRERHSALVAKTIEDNFQLVINKGAAHGVKVGDQYLIVHEGDQIYDPETGEDLGRLRLIRGRGHVVAVNEKHSILESMETKATSRRPQDRIQERLLGSIGAVAAFTQQLTPAPFNKPQEGDRAQPIN